MLYTVICISVELATAALLTYLNEYVSQFGLSLLTNGPGISGAGGPFMTTYLNGLPGPSMLLLTSAGINYPAT